MEWQPIETASKDGTVILTYGIAFGDWGYTSDEEVMYFVQWIKYRNSGIEEGKWQILQGTPRYFNGYKPYFWLKIPDLPKIPKK